MGTNYLKFNLSLSRFLFGSGNNSFFQPPLWEQRPKVKIGGKLWRKSIEEKSIPSPLPRRNQTLVKESRIIREQSASVTTERDREKERGKEKESRRGERREEKKGRKTKLSIEPPSVDVGSTIIRIENRSSGSTQQRGWRWGTSGARRSKKRRGEKDGLAGTGEETGQRRKVRVEEFLGSSRPRYAGKSEIDWREAGPCRGVCATQTSTQTPGLARQVDSEPWLNSANEFLADGPRGKEEEDGEQGESVVGSFEFSKEDRPRLVSTN